MTTSPAAIHPHKTVSHDQWIEARKQFMAKEKEFTRLRDELSRERRDLPWERVEKRYTFQGPHGQETLESLFDGRSQLIIYHFMLGPDWVEGCPSCSYLADHFDATTLHLAHRDVTLAAVSRAPYPQVAAFRKRMGWSFHWVSSYGSDFNYDFHVAASDSDRAAGKGMYNYAPNPYPVDDLPGASVFYKDPSGEIFHTYSTYARGLDILVGTYNFLDLAPKGRDEDGLKHPMAWVRHHDKYGAGYFVDADRGYELPKVARSEPRSCCSGEHHD